MEICSIIYSKLIGKKIWKRIDTHICKTESLCPTPEANTILLISCSVQFSRSVVSDPFRPHGLQHARLPCPWPTPRVYSNSCPLSWWCQPTISSSVILFSCLQSFPSLHQVATGTGVSASALVLPVNIQDQFPLGWTGWISLQSKGLSRVFSNTTVQKHQLYSSIK